jgi:hypothetical protein
VRNSNRKLHLGVVGLIATLVIGIGMPVAASAQEISSSGPTADQYDPPNVQVQTAAGGSDEGSGLTDPVGPLPFTGFDVIAMLAVALAVTGLGLALQRAVSNKPREH